MTADQNTNTDQTWTPPSPPQPWTGQPQPAPWTAPPLWQHSAPAPAPVAVAARPAVQLHPLQMCVYTLLSIASVIFIIGSFYVGMKYMELMSMIGGMGGYS